MSGVVPRRTGLFGLLAGGQLAAQLGLAIEGLDRLASPALDGAVALTARGLAGPEHGLAILDGLHAAQRWARAA